MVWLSLGSLLLGLMLLALASRMDSAPTRRPGNARGATVLPFGRRSRSGAAGGATPFICRKCGAFLISVAEGGRAERTVRCTLCDQMDRTAPDAPQLDPDAASERAIASGGYGTTLPVR